MVKLDNLKYSPSWVSHLGCVKGCLDFLGIEMTSAWLYGGTGHAFILNIGDGCCPSGPTAWKTMMLFEQGEKLGYQVQGVFGSKYNRNLEDLQKEAWAFACESMDRGLPVYGWELGIPEFYVIYGYDETGYYYSGPGAENGQGPKPWDELGDSGIGLVELYNLTPVESASVVEVVKSAFEATLKHASNTKDWIFENYASGLKGYDKWIHDLETGKANRFGMGYNTAVWLECRQQAVCFLAEAQDKLDGIASSLFDQALEDYKIVAERLEQVSRRYPWIPEGGPALISADNACQEAAGWLREAREAESVGLDILHQIAAVLCKGDNFLP